MIAGRWTSLPQRGHADRRLGPVALEQIGFFTGLGVVIVFVAALALGRFTVCRQRQAVPRCSGRSRGS